MDNDTRTSATKSSTGHEQSAGSDHQHRMYLRFALMVSTSTVVMYGLTYTNVYSAGHIRWSLERFYMAVLMGAAMALVMLAFMRSMMYRSRTLNVVIVVAALVLGVTAYFMSRTQALVGDAAYMKAMIPHHSIAILTSERADLDDVRVHDLANEIASSQRREIKEMDWLIDDIAKNGKATNPQEAAERPVPEFTGEGISSPPLVGRSALVRLLDPQRAGASQYVGTGWSVRGQQ